jgi:hypothetical protein
MPFRYQIAPLFAIQRFWNLISEKPGGQERKKTKFNQKRAARCTKAGFD